MDSPILTNKRSHEDLINKLRYVPHEIVRALAMRLLQNYSHDLKPLIKKEFDKTVNDPKQFLAKCTFEETLVLLSYKKKLPDAEISILYEEYLYGKNPTLFLFEIVKATPPDRAKIKSLIEAKFVEINKTREEKEGVNEKDFVLKTLTSESNVLELVFEFSQRVDYIDVKSSKPNYLYSKSHGICWLSLSYNSMIIKCNNWNVVQIIKKLIEEIIRAQIYNLVLNKELVDSILNPTTLVAGKYKKFGQDIDVESKNLRDSKLMSKPEGKKTNEEYERKASTHKIDLLGLPVFLNITEHGKININKKIRKTDLRNWAFELLNEVLTKIADFKTENLREYMDCIRKKDILVLSTLSENTRQIAFELTKLGMFMNDKNETNVHTDLTINKIYQHAKNYFTFFIDYSCEICSSTKIKCNTCDNSLHKISKDASLECTQCNKEISNLPDETVCEEGHKITGTLTEYITGIVNSEGRKLINDVISELGGRNPIPDNKIFVAKNRLLLMRSETSKTEYVIDDIVEFQKLRILTQIPRANITAMEQNLRNETKEKCEEYSSENCRSCLFKPPNVAFPCIQRVVGSFLREPEFHAHSGQEFGDFSFRTTIEGKDLRIPVVVKSFRLKSINNKGRKTVSRDFTMGDDDRIFSQAYTMLNMQSNEMVGFLTGSFMDERLREAIRDVARYKNKKIIFMHTPEVIRIYAHFDWTKKLPMEN